MTLAARLTNLSRRARTLSSPLSRLAFVTATEHPYAERVAVVSQAEQQRPYNVVVSIAGQDRLGVVKTFTSAVGRHNGNMEQSKMTMLGGDFAMIAHLRLRDDVDAAKLEKQLRAELEGFSVTIRMTDPPPRELLFPTGRVMWRLQLVGPDQPGIVSAVAQVLVAYGANVHEMETDVFGAPFSGESLFRVNGKIAIDDLMLGAITRALTNVEDVFGLTISLDQIDDGPTTEI